MLTGRIRGVHSESDATNGMPRVRAELIDRGMKVSRQRVTRLMRLAHICDVSRHRAWVVTACRDKDKQPAPDLVKHEFKADGPNQLWVADMTYVPTWAGFSYLPIARCPARKGISCMAFDPGIFGTPMLFGCRRKRRTPRPPACPSPAARGRGTTTPGWSGRSSKTRCSTAR